MNERPQYSVLLRKLICGICYHPQTVEIKQVTLPCGNVTFYVTVHANDAGLVIGAAGRIIKAIQLIFRLISKKNGNFMQVFVDKKGEITGRAPLFKSVDSWSKTGDAIQIVEEILVGAGFEAKIDYEEVFDNTVLTFDTNAPNELVEAVSTVIRAWGKSQGRRIELAKTEQVKIA